MRRQPVAGRLTAAVLGCAAFLWAQAPSSPPGNPLPSSADIVAVPEGERLVLELEDSLHTRRTRQGDHAHFTTFHEILVGSRVVIPRGSSVRATVTESKRPGRIKGRAEIRLRFDEIILPDGTTLSFAANILRAGFFDLGGRQQEPRVQAEGSKGRDITTIAMGGGQGALLGAIVGGKKGAAYGGAVGAGIGLLSVLLQRGPELDLPAGTFFEVELDRALEIPLASVQSFNQLAQTGPSTTSSPAAGSAGFYFPDSVPAESAAESEIPADLAGDTAEIATNRGSTLPPSPSGSSTTTSRTAGEAEPSASLDPTFGDPDAYRLKVDVRLVLVDVFVRDERGRPLDQLAREDFQLFEDGVEQKVRHFSRDELPLAVALVVDRSGSVLPYMPELRRAAYDTLRQLKPGDQVALFSFAGDVDRLEDLTTDRRRIAERVASIRAGGGTNITDAVYLAAQYLGLAAPDRRRAIVLISDNQATVRGHATQGDAIRMALEAEVTVYSIKTPGENTRGRVLGIPVPLPGMGTGSVRRIAEETGGEVIDVERVGSLAAALQTVVSRLKTRYTLGYHPTNKAADGSFRRVEVRLAEGYGRPGRDYDVYAKRGYYAPSEQVASQPAP